MEDFYLQLKLCGAVLSHDDYVWKFFTSPIITWQKKAQLIETVFSSRVNRYLVSFFVALLKRNRFADLFAIQSLLRKAVNQHLGQRAVLVYSARELQEEEEKELRLTLKEYFGKSIMLQKFIREELLAGLSIRSGDLVLNSSLQNRIRGIQKTLLECRVTGTQYYEN